MTIQFQKATKRKAKLRLAFVGPAGSGKTYSSLRVASAIVPGGKVAVFDSEHGSASKYAGLFEFDSFEPASFSPQVYIDAIEAAEKAGYDVLILDSLSHAWMGKDGALEMVDKAAARNRGNSFAGWRDVTPLHNRLIDAMLASRLHLIVTMRSKTEWVLEEDDKGKKVPRRIGLQPVQRDGLEYEFDVVGDLDQDARFVVSKTRCPALAGVTMIQPGEKLADALRAWLSDGAEIPRATPEQLAQIAELSGAKLLDFEERQSLQSRIDAGLTPERAERALVWLRGLPDREADVQPGLSLDGAPA